MAHGRPTWKDLPMPLKMTLCCLLLASLVLIAAWLASSGGGTEYVISRMVAALPLPKSASNWLAPPYLFLTVHFIILLIWKLSDHHKPQGHHQPLPAVPKHNLSVPAPAPAPAPVVAAQQGYYQWHPQQQHEQQQHEQQQQEHHRDLSHDDASCTTDDTSDRNSTASSSPLLIRRNERLPPAVLGKQIPTPSPPEQPALVKEEEKQEEGELIDNVDDSMDATWRAIMAKTSRPVAAAAAATTDRTIDQPEMSAAGADDEMNQRFEEFIKKSRDQMMAMAN